MKARRLVLLALLPVLVGPSLPVRADGNREVVEEIVARVNNEIITLSDLERSRQLLRQELGQRTQGAELEHLYGEQEPDLLRDLIDQSLLVQRALDRGLSVEADVIKRLDQIRQNMKLNSMEELERAMTAQGVSIEDYKQQVRNQLLAQMLIQRAVASNVFVDAEKVRQYYLAHREELIRPEQIHLREILVSTENYKSEELPAREERVREILAKIRKGEKFEELAREYSDAPTGEDGGDLGYFEPDKLAPSVREAVEGLLDGGVADPMPTRQGYLILQVVEHHAAGIPPFEEVESEIRERLYLEEVQPALREFLNDLRREAYVYVKTGYQDTGAIEQEAPPVRAGSRRSSRRRPE
jgi:peptidyl-prolyl cis-trans isomerase SurA